MIGPGKYPQRVTTAKGKNFDLPDEDGRRNTYVLFCYFASEVFPVDSENILMENCEVDGIDCFFYITDSFPIFQSGGILKDFTLRNVSIKNLKEPSFYTPHTVFNIDGLKVDEASKKLLLPGKEIEYQ